MSSRPPKENLDRNFGLILHDVARLLRTDFDRRVRDLGLTRSQWWVLTHLFRQDGLTQTELAALMEIEKPSLGKLLDRLEHKGWINRRSDPTDRRVNRVHLTARVEPLVAEMRRHAADVRAEALSGISAIERERFVDTLLQIKGNLLAQSTAPVASEGQSTAIERGASQSHPAAEQQETRNVAAQRRAKV